MYFWLLILVVALLAYILFDVHYFVRVVITYILGEYVGKKMDYFQSSVIYGENKCEN